MAKTRSPRYPAIGLKEAVDKVRAVWESDYQNPIPRLVAAEHMGYASLNGKSLGVLSALNKYGLLEGRGDDTRVTDEAVIILAHEPGSPDRLAALQEAASKPELFKEINARFPEGKASDQALRSYLITKKFIPTAADAAIRAFRETQQLVSAESAGYDPHREAELIEEAIAEEEMQHYQQPKTKPQTNPRLPFRVSVTTDSLAVDAELFSAKDVDALIRILEANKVMLPAEPDKAGDTEQ